MNELSLFPAEKITNEKITAHYRCDNPYCNTEIPHHRETRQFHPQNNHIHIQIVNCKKCGEKMELEFTAGNDG